jgi:hypothetical protein
MPIFKIIASQIGNDAGPFTIKNNLNQVIATGVTRLQLLNGYSFNIAAGITSVKVTSTGACTNDISIDIPDEGYWVMAKGGVEQVSDHYGAIQTAYVAPVEAFVADNVVGVYTGTASGTGNLLIKGGPQAIAGTSYNGGGTFIATNANTNTTTTVENGAIVQLGFNLEATKGSFGGTTTVNAGGTINVVGADEPNGRAVFSTLVNNGNVNITGNDVCGQGYFSTASLDNKSLVTIDKAVYRPVAYAAGVGTILVKDGATLEIANTGIPSTQTIQLNSIGKCNEIGRTEGAMLYGVAAYTIAAKIEVLTPSTIKHLAGGLVTINGQLTGNNKLTIENYTGSTTAAGQTTFANGTGGTFDNTIEVKNTTLYNTGTTALQKADIVLVENGRMQQDGGTFNIGSLATTSTTASILANSSVTMNILENGNTTYDGVLQNSTPGAPWTLNVYGPNTNQLKLTNTGSVVNLNSIDGAKIIAQSGTYEFWNSTNGGTISAGNSTATRIKTLYLQANAFLDIYKSGAGVGMITAQNVAYLIAGWKVNLMEAMPAGTFTILISPNPTGAYANLPTIGTNTSGLTATFAWVGTALKMTLI